MIKKLSVLLIFSLSSLFQVSLQAKSNELMVFLSTLNKNFFDQVSSHLRAEGRRCKKLSR